MQTETLNHCHVKEERAWLFRSEDTQTTEDEYLHLLHALVYCLKPVSVLETGAFKGFGTAFMAKALKRNGLGRVTSVECAHPAVEWAVENLRVNGVSDWATVVEADSIDFLTHTERTFDFALFDSQLPLRYKELKLCLDRKLLHAGDMCAFHDTSKLRTISPGTPDPQTATLWRELEGEGRIKFVEFPYSRGLVLAQVL